MDLEAKSPFQESLVIKCSVSGSAMSLSYVEPYLRNSPGYCLKYSFPCADAKQILFDVENSSENSGTIPFLRNCAELFSHPFLLPGQILI